MGVLYVTNNCAKPRVQVLGSYVPMTTTNAVPAGQPYFVKNNSTYVISSLAAGTPVTLTENCPQPRAKLFESYIPMQTVNQTSAGRRYITTNGSSYLVESYVTRSNSRSESASQSYLTSSDSPAGMSSTTALTRSSTSNTVYQTRSSTSGTTYLTRQSTSGTTYLTRVSTSGTSYGTVNGSSYLSLTSTRDGGSATFTESILGVMSRSTTGVFEYPGYFTSTYTAFYAGYVSQLTKWEGHFNNTGGTVMQSYAGTLFSIYAPAKYGSTTSPIITGTTYLTRASTSGTNYGTRASTSGTVYGTRASTSATVYQTRSSTSGYSGVSSSSSSMSISSSEGQWS